MRTSSWRRIVHLGWVLLVLLLVAAECDFPTAQLSIDGDATSEGDLDDDTTLTFTVVLDAAVVGGVQVDYRTRDGTATVADRDYVSTSGTLDFSGTAGERRTITVTVTGDDEVEPDETFHVILSNIVYAGNVVTFADDRAQGVILNDDTLEEESATE